MKNKLLFLLSLLLFLTITMSILVACDEKEKIVTNYYLDNDGHLIAEYLDQSNQDLGEWGNTLIQSFEKIEISKDNYYIINSIKTKIKAKTISGYYLNQNGTLIAVYNDQTEEECGSLDNTIAYGINDITISDDGYYIINSIKTNIQAVATYIITFNSGYSVNVNSQVVKEGTTIAKPTLNRDGYTLDGWYCNDEKWVFNTNVVTRDLTLEARWTANEYEITYVNDKVTPPAAENITYGEEFTVPEVAEVDGYTFLGWYRGTTKITSGNWSIASDVELTAKWQAKTYTVTINPNGGSVNKTSMTVTYGQNYTLPKATNSSGVFVGWYYNDELITDGNGASLAPWAFTSNITVTTSWVVYIDSLDDFELMRTYPNGNFELTTNIVALESDWVPIGTSSSPFAGTFNGNNHSITGLRRVGYSSSIDSYGMFGYVKNASISNLILLAEYIHLTGITTNTTAGGLIGTIASQSNTVLIKNVTIAGEVAISNHSASYESVVGGFVGEANSSVSFENCINSSDVTGSYAAGFVAHGVINTDSNFRGYNINNGDISATTSAGGILAITKSISKQPIIISNYINNGTITSDGSAGGIVGISNSMANDSIVKYSANKGDVTGGTNAAGIVGYPSMDILNCYNTGHIIGDGGSAFGICSAVSGSVVGCYNIGTVEATGNNYIAGITYNVMGILADTVNFGDVIGGIGRYSIYAASYGTATNCYYNCSMTGTYTGEKTEETYSALFYTNTLYWQAYNPLTDEGVWVFHNDAYPTLWFE